MGCIECYFQRGVENLDRIHGKFNVCIKSGRSSVRTRSIFRERNFFSVFFPFFSIIPPYFGNGERVFVCHVAHTRFVPGTRTETATWETPFGTMESSIILYESCSIAALTAASRCLSSREQERERNRIHLQIH